MKLRAVAFIVFANLMAVLSFAGTILFDPPSITITPGTQSVSFETRAVPESLATFDTVYAIFGSLEGLNMSFLPDSDLFPDFPAYAYEIGLYDFMTGGVGTDIGVGGQRIAIPLWQSVRLGVLTVDTSILAAGDVRQIIVSPELEGQAFDDPSVFFSLLGNGATHEPLRGALSISVVPEPATIGVLLVGMLSMLGRRSRGKSGINEAQDKEASRGIPVSA